MSLDEVPSELGTTKFHRRDNDKLDMIERAMEQFEVDIKSPKAGTTIAIGLVSCLIPCFIVRNQAYINITKVSNLYARSQGNFQSLMLQAAERDSSNMRTIATLTVLLLPATFLAVRQPRRKKFRTDCFGRFYSLHLLSNGLCLLSRLLWALARTVRIATYIDSVSIATIIRCAPGLFKGPFALPCRISPRRADHAS